MPTNTPNLNLVRPLVTEDYTVEVANDNADKIDEVVGGTLIGWNKLNATLTYASADSPTFVANTSIDLTSVISVGMKLKLTQTTVKYFIVTAITSTTITLYGGTDYTLVNVTITLPYFSSMKAPFGFPLNISKWSIAFTVDTTTVTNSPVVGTWYNRNTYSFPIGLWKVGYLLGMYPIRATDGIVGSKCTLSTINNGETNSDLSSLIYMAPITQCILQSTLTDYILNLTTKTNYYLNIKTDYAGLTSIQFWTIPTPRVYLVCAYL